MKSYKQVIQILLIAFVVFMSGCKNDLEKIHLFTDDTTLPTLYGKNITMFRSDSGKLNMRMTSPKIKRFDNADEPFTEFPAGLDIYFLDSAQQVETHISANYTIYYEQQNLYYARDSVVVKNLKTNEWVKSEEMYWDEVKGIVYSDKFSTIKKDNGIYYGHDGFECKQDLSYWKIKSSKDGKMILTDE